MTISVHPESKYIVINDCSSSSYYLQICNRKGMNIYNGYMKPINDTIEIKGLQKGDYTISISDEHTKTIKNIKI